MTSSVSIQCPTFDDLKTLTVGNATVINGSQWSIDPRTSTGTQVTDTLFQNAVNADSGYSLIGGNADPYLNGAPQLNCSLPSNQGIITVSGVYYDWSCQQCTYQQCLLNGNLLGNSTVPCNSNKISNCVVTCNKVQPNK